MKRCDKCGAPSTDDSAFCGECGSTIATHDTVADAVPDAPAPQAGTVPGGPISAAMKAAPALAPPAGAPRGPSRPRHVPPGTVVDKKYAIERVLGEGGMGVVYLARDVNTGVEVVLKAIRVELAHRNDVRERTLAEGRALAHIDHANVVQLKAVVAEGDSLWLVMQYVDGESLETTIAHHVQTRQPIPVPEVLRIFRQMLAGVGAAHREGVIHRDLKPANILIRKKDGVAKVSDFGIAKVEEDARAGRGQTKGIIGSLWYMSPEQVSGRRDLDKRVDIYALGIVLYEMLVGHVPFDAESDYEIMKMHTSAPVPWVSKMRKDVPLALDEIIQKACAKDREARYPSCEEFLAALDAVDAPAARARTPSPPVEDPGPRHTALGPRGPVIATAEIPPERPARAGWMLPVIGIVVVAAGSLAVMFGTGFLQSPGVTTSPSGRSAETSPSSSAHSTAQPASSGGPPRSPLESLAGTWVTENGRHFDAVLAGGALEFRVHDSTEFLPQDYQTGEARIVLRPRSGDSTSFDVEDRIRPLPPAGMSYDSANARSTCLALFTKAGTHPLTAVFDGTRLAVDFAKIEPSPGNFVMDGNKVASCRGLERLGASKTPVVLNRL